MTKIRVYRTRKKITIAEMATDIILSPSTLSWIECKRMVPLEAQKERIAEYLGHTVDELFGESGLAREIELEG
jgi:transcriptional regulator with XRE-family HTH domain